jgi:hypothetical protein
MTTSDKTNSGRGRPRKFQPGETVEWRLRAPDSLLLELRIAARMSERSVNEEIITRLLQSLNYQTDKSLISTVDAEKLIYLAVKFEEWLSGLINNTPAGSADCVASKDETVWIWRESEKRAITGKISGHNIRIPENLATEIKVMARLHDRSQNEEVLTRLLDSFGYYSQRILEQNEDVQALKVLCIEFEEYLKVKIKEAENPSIPDNPRS